MKFLLGPVMDGMKSNGPCVYAVHITLAYTMKDFIANDVGEY